ncbi:MAG: LAGLIDADG family homing endonuclease [Candidatus Nanoarchaeia archaeon]
MKLFVLNEKIAEEIGIHAGDGSMNIYGKTYAYTLACHHLDDKEFMDNYVIPLYEKIYGLKIKPKIWSKGAYGFRVSCKEMIKFKHEILGLPLGSKETITIPKQILDNKQFTTAFLRGFFSTDGSINSFLANKKTIYPRLEMCNISIELMQQINHILKNRGFRTSIWRINKNKGNWKEGLRLAVTGYEMLDKWNKEIGFINPKQRRKAEELLSKKINIFKET